MLSNMQDPHYFHELRSRSDRWLMPWLDLYQQAFSLDEQRPCSEVLKVLKRLETGREKVNNLLAILDREHKAEAAGGTDDPRFAGLLWYEHRPKTNAVILWYFATERRLRCRGVGGGVLRQFLSEARDAGHRAVLFEVEHPQFVDGRTVREVNRNRKLAERRIEFYRRNGAVLFDSIVYRLKVPNRQPVRMYLMAIPLIDGLPEQYLEGLIRHEFQKGISALDTTSE